jgi:hypothetical protein
MNRPAHIVIAAALTLIVPRLAWTGELVRIYVYVQQETPARSWFPVSCDGAVVAEIKRGRFFAVNVAPGRHMLSEEKGVPTFVDARSGRDSFIRLNWHIEVGQRPIPVWEIVDAASAYGDMLTLTYIDAAKALSKSVPKKDPRGPPRLTRRGATDDQ